MSKVKKVTGTNYMDNYRTGFNGPILTEEENHSTALETLYPYLRMTKEQMEVKFSSGKKKTIVIRFNGPRPSHVPARWRGFPVVVKE